MRRIRHNIKHRILIGVLGFLSFLLFACTIVPDEEEKADVDRKAQFDNYFVDDTFKPDEFVETIWDSKVVPYFKQTCLPISEVVPAWKQDQEAAGRKFGYREKSEGSPWNFLVAGTGVIVGVNTKSRASTVDVDLDPQDGNGDITLQIGPVIKDTGIRDTLEFISFTDFNNQLEFARLSNALNKKVNAAVIDCLDRENLMDKRIAFHGVFTQLQDSDLVRITPVVLEVE
jgi:predicted lipoprotein